MAPNILILDIETAPALAEVWQLWDVNIALNQVMRDPYVMCFAAKWYGRKEVEFYREDIAVNAHDLLSAADIVVHFNGRRFDIPHLHREILLAGLKPPAPFKQVDLYEASKRQFKWLSNKLDYVAQQLGVGQKVAHPGHALWTRCIDGDEAAWKLMRRYNIQDVKLTEKVYDALLPWLPNHPHLGLFVDSGNPVCPRCGSERLQRRGQQPTVSVVYQRFQCQDCGGWTRGTAREGGAGGSRLL